MRMRPLRAALAPLALVLATAVAGLTGPAVAVDADSYDNPILPRIPGDGRVETCADPTVIKGQQRGDDRWYMYCTSDPLNEDDRRRNGDLRFRPIPMMVSRDLVNWRYVGDALPEAPSWAAEGAGLWAPDIVYSHTKNRYYLTFTVTDVDKSISGVDCPGDDPDDPADDGKQSAIGVATSRSPLGPWRISDRPAIKPRHDPNSTDPCAFLWTFDPDVLGDSVGDRSVMYFGSYYGGNAARRVEFTRTGIRRISPERPIGIGDRYEGLNVIKRKGFYYLFGSATNCCAGPRTGYSVFAARSLNPMGPFRDREGNSILDPRVGGTPVLSMNGNRWVGPGHNSVFRDFDGQWWTMYHAIDRNNPYIDQSINLNRRPAMLDPIVWIDGWPTVRAGRWISERRMPAPAAQPGEVSRYRPKPVAEFGPDDPFWHRSDGFENDSLDPQWSWVRKPPNDTYAVRNGRFVFQSQEADLTRDSNNASVLVERAPDGEYVVQTKVRLNVPEEGNSFNYTQAGLVLYSGDNRFIKLVHVSIWGTRQTEFAKEVPAPELPEGASYGNTVVGTPGDWTTLRIVKREVQRQNGGVRELYTAYTRQDNKRWVRGGTWTHRLGDRARIGLVSMGEPDNLDPALDPEFVAKFDYVRVSTVERR
jgi:arabinan endo-1,5-alpha-L-arabinosidase